MTLNIILIFNRSTVQIFNSQIFYGGYSICCSCHSACQFHNAKLNAELFSTFNKNLKQLFRSGGRKHLLHVVDHFTSTELN